MKIITYLHFPGQAEEALNFYKEVVGGEVIMLSRMGEGPMDTPEHLKKQDHACPNADRRYATLFIRYV